MEAFADSLRRELMIHGIDVVVIGANSDFLPYSYDTYGQVIPAQACLNNTRFQGPVLGLPRVFTVLHLIWHSCILPCRPAIFSLGRVVHEIQKMFNNQIL